MTSDDVQEMLSSSDLEDPTTRLVLADALEEVGRCEEAALMRRTGGIHGCRILLDEETGDVVARASPDDLEPIERTEPDTRRPLGYLGGWWVVWRFDTASQCVSFDLREDEFPEHAFGGDGVPRVFGRNEAREAVEAWLLREYGRIQRNPEEDGDYVYPDPGTILWVIEMRCGGPSSVIPIDDEMEW